MPAGGAHFRKAQGAVQLLRRKIAGKGIQPDGLLSHFSGFLNGCLHCPVGNSLPLQPRVDPQHMNRGNLVVLQCSAPGVIPGIILLLIGQQHQRRKNCAVAFHIIEVAIVNMFPGENGVVLYFADTGARRGARAALAEPMLQELKKQLGDGNVVVK